MAAAPKSKRRGRARTSTSRAKARSRQHRRGAGGKYWSARVMQRSDALDIEHGAFAQRSPRAVAASLKRSADRSKRRKAGPFQSAMSMLNFYINRGGKTLPQSRRRVLERAKLELRKLYGRE